MSDHNVLKYLQDGHHRSASERDLKGKLVGAISVSVKNFKGQKKCVCYTFSPKVFKVFINKRANKTPGAFLFFGGGEGGVG